MKNTKYILFAIALLSISLQSCEFGKQYTYTTRQGRLDDVNQQKLADLGVVNTTPNSSPSPSSSSAPTPTPNPVNVKGKAKIAINTAWKYEGVKYSMGGTTKKGMDCSGLMLISWQAANVQLPRVSSEQAKKGKPVSFNNLQPGDLVFFHPHGGTRINHVGMVTEVDGDKTYFIHASTSKGVMESELTSAYWKGIFSRARRVH